jgi:two-component system, response regulator PdtaR
MARRMHENACLFEGRGRNLSGFGNLDLVGGSVQLKILLVEDEPFILMDIELQLQQDSHFVVSASDADKAIVVLRTQAVDVVLTDIDMPGSMHGLGLAAAVRDRWPSVRIVVMSGSSVQVWTNCPRRPGLCRSRSTIRSSGRRLVRGKLGILDYPASEDAGMICFAAFKGRLRSYGRLRWHGGPKGTLWA